MSEIVRVAKLLHAHQMRSLAQHAPSRETQAALVAMAEAMCLGFDQLLEEAAGLRTAPKLSDPKPRERASIPSLVSAKRDRFQVQEEIMAFLLTNPKRTTADVADGIHISLEFARDMMGVLSAKGRLISQRSMCDRRAFLYSVNPSVLRLQRAG